VGGVVRVKGTRVGERVTRVCWGEKRAIHSWRKLQRRRVVSGVVWVYICVGLFVYLVI
jgi:hypothetical protein